MARGAADLGADARRVVETHGRLWRVIEHARPDEVLAAFAHGRDQFDAGPIRGDGVVTHHACPDAGKPGHGTSGRRFVAVLRAADLPEDVHGVWEFDRLFGPL